MKMEPPAGVAPAGFLYKRNLQTAAWRQNWSQSPVLPWTELAYETCLSAGSTAVLADGHLAEDGEQNGSLTRSCIGLARLPSESITENALRAVENGRRETTCTSKAA